MLKYNAIKSIVRLACLVLLPSGLCGCRTARESTPPRTATEQLLLSAAAERATEDRYFAWLTGKKIYVEDKYFDSYDKGDAISMIRERLSASGALLMKSDDKADVIVEIRSAALSMDNSTTLLGVPTMTVPVPLAGPLQTPEIAFYKSNLSDSVAKFVLFAYERESGRYLSSGGTMLGRAHLHLYKILFVSWKKTDVSELTRARVK